MTELTVFKCDFCGKDFETENDCKNHEKLHVDMDSVVGVRYLSTGAYPDYIKVKMKDNKEFYYGRRVEVMTEE
jgi:hypothetical protein